MFIVRALDAVTCVALCGSALVSSSALAGSNLTVTLATGSTSDGSGCLEQCTSGIGTPCDITCSDATRFLSEYANVTIAITPISIEATGVADALTFGGKVMASAMAHYRVDFTIADETFFYTNWNVFFQPADTNFLPKDLPKNGEYVGSLEPGAYFIEGMSEVTGSALEANGLLFRLIPDFFADCDNDGTFDWREIADGTQSDTNNNGIPDDCDLQSDLDGDGDVDAADLGILLGDWGVAGGPADLNGNGLVGPEDLGILLGDWTG